MLERIEDATPGLTPEEVNRQIKLAELNLQRFSGRTLEEVVIAAMGKYNDDPEMVADSLVAQKVFEKSADCTNPQRSCFSSCEEIHTR